MPTGMTCAQTFAQTFAPVTPTQRRHRLTVAGLSPAPWSDRRSVCAASLRRPIRLRRIGALACAHRHGRAPLAGATPRKSTVAQGNDAFCIFTNAAHSATRAELEQRLHRHWRSRRPLRRALPAEGGSRRSAAALRARRGEQSACEPHLGCGSACLGCRGQGCPGSRYRRLSSRSRILRSSATWSTPASGGRWTHSARL